MIMAENSVTIALKLDSSHFNAELLKAQRRLSNMEFAPGFGGGRGGGGRAPSPADDLRNILDRSFRNQDKEQARALKELNRSIAMQIRERRAAAGIGVAVGGAAGGDSKQKNFFQKLLGTAERGLAQSVAMLKGNFSAANTLGSINMVADASLSSLGTIAVAAALIVVGISTLQTVLKPIMKILGAIGKVLGAALIPIAMVIVYLLQPLITLLIPFVRLMNALLKPFMKDIKKGMAGVAQLFNMGKILEGFLFAILAMGKTATLIIYTVLVGVLKMFVWLSGEIGKIIGTAIAWLAQILVNILAFVAKSIVSAISLVLQGIVGALAVMGSNMMGVMNAGLKMVPFADKIPGLNDMIAFTAKAQKDFTTFGTTMSSTILANEKTINSGITVFAQELKDKIQTELNDSIEGIDAFVSKVNLGFDKSVVDMGVTLDTFVSGALTTFKGSVAGIGEQFIAEANNVNAAKNALKSGNNAVAVAAPAAGSSGTVAAASAAPLGSAQNPTPIQLANMNAERVAAVWKPIQLQLMAAGLAYGNPAYYVTGSGAALGYQYQNVPGFNPAAAMSTIQSGEYAKYIHAGSIGDGVITPSGQIVRTNPRDYIMATTDPSSMGGGSGNVYNIVFNVQGNVDDKTARFITDTVQREIAQQWRAIAR